MTALRLPGPSLPIAAALLAAVLSASIGYGLSSERLSSEREPDPSKASGLEAVERPMLRDDLSPADRPRVATATRLPDRFDRLQPFETMAGGAATLVRLAGRDSLSQPTPLLDAAARSEFELGNALFEKLWVSAPSSTQASDGLGPLYNARACATCHVRDGRGHALDEGEPPPSLVLRLIGADDKGDPTYGRQLQTSAVPGQQAEARPVIRFETETVTLAGGEQVTLRRPHIALTDLAYGPLDPATHVSPRLAPAMTGLGLIEAIHPADLLAGADPDDRDGNGISGRAITVIDPATAQSALGRFGWKAEMPDIRAQAATAFSTDLGISTPERSESGGDCTVAQAACLAAPDGVQARLGPVEAPDPVLKLVADYARHLAVPARRGAERPEVLAGKALFFRSGCADCHRPSFVTGRQAPVPFAFQLIWPYSDLLLHDMGEGLADPGPGGEERPDRAGRREWRTPPLWAIGLASEVDPRAGFLHDGRARTLQEAILWHGGEGQAARDRYSDLSAPERRALLAFVESL
ncbi:di-heme oxidoredictase family protein [Rhizobium sp. YIM 134829]|uniref:di-heme oxidoreductase family protein n=1 Tax=Rhizobium sp. YIM 134829 TaxID=3390453 RepID=UPI003978F8F9